MTLLPNKDTFWGFLGLQYIFFFGGGTQLNSEQGVSSQTFLPVKCKHFWSTHLHTVPTPSSAWDFSSVEMTFWSK